MGYAVRRGKSQKLRKQEKRPIYKKFKNLKKEE
jgi:hypothetical protein